MQIIKHVFKHIDYHYYHLSQLLLQTLSVLPLQSK
jgi:hypothetical protein